MNVPNRNYDREMEEALMERASSSCVPRLLLHACCAPCSSAVLERLSPYFQITVLYYNPNIFPEEEYRHRVEELRRLVRESAYPNPVEVVECFREDFWNEISPGEYNRLLTLLIEKAVVWNDRLEIEFKTGGVKSLMEEFKNG